MLVGAQRGRLAGDAAVVEHDDPVGDGQQLVEVRADQQHAGARVAAAAQLGVHELGGADVDAARRLRGQHEARLALELAGDHELLRVAARQRRRRVADRADPHVELLDQPPRPLA